MKKLLYYLLGAFGIIFATYSFDTPNLIEAIGILMVIIWIQWTAEKLFKTNPQF